MQTQVPSSASETPEHLSRLATLLGPESLAKLRGSRVAVIGLGGVGSWAAEALARSGVGTMLVVDGDTVALSDLNRQLFSVAPKLGRPKALAARARLADAAPWAIVDARDTFFTRENSQFLLDFKPDCVIDAIDRFSDKIALLEMCHGQGIPIVCSMGAGGRTDPSCVRSADISRSKGCPLARKVRTELRKLGIEQGITVVFSDESPIPPTQEEGLQRATQGSCVWVTGTFGFALAAAAVKILTK
jgi:tRNA A37 threonylcarbamoyladenosine dehydratase